MISGVGDAGYALRQLRRSPRSTVLVILTLGLAMGAGTTIFTIANALLLRPFPVEEPESLVRVFTTRSGQTYGITSWPDYEDLRDGVDAFEGLAAFGLTTVGLRSPAGAEPVVAEMVTWNYFRVLGVQPALGRSFLPEEEAAPGAAPVAVLSHRAWIDRFAADPAVVGSTLYLSDVPYTVVGVAPEGFAGLSALIQPAVWVPSMMVGAAYPWEVNLQGRIDPWLNLVGRLRPGVTMAGAQASLDAVAAGLAQAYPRDNRGKVFTATDLDRARIAPNETTDGARRMSWLLMTVAGLVLLTACFNVANLHLARAIERRREIALRSAVGASRWRIARQLFAEDLLLACAAGLAALLFADWAAEALWSLQPPSEFPLQVDLSVDLRVVTFTAATALLAALLIATAPALEATRSRALAALHVGVFGPGRRREARSQRVLVAGQLAFCAVVLLTAGLFLRSLRQALRIDPGFDLRWGLVAPVNLAYTQFDEDQARLFFEELDERIEELPGVRSASLSAAVPLGLSHGHHDVHIEGYEPGPDEWMLFKRNMVDGDYLRTLGIAVVRGRGIDDRDRADTQPVAVVNETMARRFWPDGDPIGKILRADLGVPRVVVGVIQDGKYSSLSEPHEPYLAIPLSQSGSHQRLLLTVRTEGEAAPLREAVRHQILAAAPELPVSVRTLEEHLALARGPARGLAMLVSAFGLLALAIALIGVYGLTAYVTSRRSHEFGVRVALGAQPSSIARLVMTSSVHTTLVGVGLGLLLAVGVSQLVAGLLYDVHPLDPIVFATAAPVLIAVALLAAYLPARAAARSDPASTLRLD